ncbi:hypothetical protein TKK_0015367 [Trichogramma kaykai]
MDVMYLSQFNVSVMIMPNTLIEDEYSKWTPFSIKRGSCELFFSIDVYAKLPSNITLVFSALRCGRHHQLLLTHLTADMCWLSGATRWEFTPPRHCLRERESISGDDLERLRGEIDGENGSDFGEHDSRERVKGVIDSENGSDFGEMKGSNDIRRSRGG